MVSLTRMALLPFVVVVIVALCDGINKKINPPPTYKEILSSVSVDPLTYSNPTAVITGCTSGIGLSLTRTLHDDLGFTVICLSRSNQKMSDVKSANRWDNFVGIRCDLSDLYSVQSAMASVKDLLKSKSRKINYLINNGGMHYGALRLRDNSKEEDKRSRTKQGFDQVFAANYLGHFLLTEGLLDSMEAVEGLEKARVIQVSSSYHWASDGEMLRRVSERRDTVLKSPVAATGRTGNDADTPRIKDLSYGNSKLAQILHAKKLAVLHPDIDFVSICPSWVGTNIVSPNEFWLAHKVINFLAFDVDTDGIVSTLLALFHPSVQSGDYLANTRASEYVLNMAWEWTSTTPLIPFGKKNTTVFGTRTWRDAITHAFAGFLMIFQRFGFGGPFIIHSSPESYDEGLQDDLYEFSKDAIAKYL